jgi:RimJ/RimL family protein N-acetyltransferase
VEKAESLWHKLLNDYYPKGINTIFGVFLNDTKKHIGTCSIRPRPTKKDDWEITYILKSEEWGKGYATEIARKLIEFGFEELKLNAVFATVDTDNSASIHVLEKVGMNHIRDEYDELGKFYVYGINA